MITWCFMVGRFNGRIHLRSYSGHACARSDAAGGQQLPGAWNLWRRLWLQRWPLGELGATRFHSDDLLQFHIYLIYLQWNFALEQLHLSGVSASLFFLNSSAQLPRSGELPLAMLRIATAGEILLRLSTTTVDAERKYEPFLTSWVSTCAKVSRRTKTHLTSEIQPGFHYQCPAISDVGGVPGPGGCGPWVCETTDPCPARLSLVHISSIAAPRPQMFFFSFPIRILRDWAAASSAKAKLLAETLDQPLLDWYCIWDVQQSKHEIQSRDIKSSSTDFSCCLYNLVQPNPAAGGQVSPAHNFWRKTMASWTHPKIMPPHGV